MSLDSAIRILAAASGTKIGFESSDTVDGREQVVELATSLPVRDMEPALALAVLLGKKGHYTWFESEGVLVVRPADAQGRSRRTFLDTLMDIDLKNVTLSEAAVRIVGFHAPEALRPAPWEPGEPRRSARALPPGVPAWVGEPSALMARRLSTRVRETPTWELLNAIVRAHGEASWGVVYRRVDGSKPGLQATIQFYTFDGAGYVRNLPSRWR